MQFVATKDLQHLISNGFGEAFDVSGAEAFGGDGVKDPEADVGGFEELCICVQEVVVRYHHWDDW